MEGTPTLVVQIIQILVSAIPEYAKGLGEGLNTLIKSLFLNATGGLGDFGQIIITFAAIALAITLSRWVLNFVTSLGRRNS